MGSRPGITFYRGTLKTGCDGARGAKSVLCILMFKPPHHVQNGSDDTIPVSSDLLPDYGQDIVDGKDSPKHDPLGQSSPEEKHGDRNAHDAQFGD